MVTEISGPLITGESTIRFSNGTELTETCRINVENSDETPTVDGMIISTHYSRNDNIANVPHLNIDQILVKQVNSEPREMFYSPFTARMDEVFFDYDYFWDKETGVLIEMSYDMEYPEGSTIGSGTGRFELKLVESNKPEIPEFSSLVVLVFLISLVLIINKKRLIKRT